MTRALLILVLVLLFGAAVAHAQYSQVAYYGPGGAYVQPVPVTSYYAPAPATVYYGSGTVAPAYYSTPVTAYYGAPRAVYYPPAMTTFYRPLVGGITRVRYAPVSYSYPVSYAYQTPYPTTVFYRY